MELQVAYVALETLACNLIQKEKGKGEQGGAGQHQNPTGTMKHSNIHKALLINYGYS